MTFYLRNAFRQLWSRPAFTVFAVLTLALGIGANVAIFTVIEAVFWKQLPVRDPQRLVYLSNPGRQGFSFGSDSGRRDLMTYAEYQHLRDRNQVLAGLAAVTAGARRFDISWGGREATIDHVHATLVSGDYFSVLGVDMRVGRGFSEEIDRPVGAHPVVVLAYAYWQKQFGGDPAVLGRKLTLNHTAFEVVGVAARGFVGETVGTTVDLWFPLSMQSAVMPGNDYLTEEKDPLGKAMWLHVIGRLRAGVTREQAQVELNGLFQRYIQAQSARVSVGDRRDFLDQHVEVSDGQTGGSHLRGQYSKPLDILMGLVAALLLIACANVGNLLLARAAGRQKEMAIRVAIGANPRRIFLQLLTESLAVALVGGFAGIAVAFQGAHLLESFARTDLNLHLDASMLAFALGAALLAGALFGTAPALQAARFDQNSLLKATTAVTGGRWRLTAPRILVVVQVALSVLMLALAGLFVRSFQNLAAIDVGFDRDHLLIFGVDALGAGYKPDDLPAFYRRLRERLAAVPGVRGATLSSNGLFSGSESDDPIAIDGFVPAEGQKMDANFDCVGPSYFSTVGIPVLLGREIGPQDGAGSQRVAVINQTMAKYYFKDANPIGRHMRDTYGLIKEGGFTIVGVVADAKYNALKEKTPRRFYLPWENPVYPVQYGHFEVRAFGDPVGVIAGIRAAVTEVAPVLPRLDIQTLNDLTSRTIEVDRMLTRLSGVFGGLALLLASLGIYAVMSYGVARRTREIGIRMALGSPRGAVLALILRDSLLVAALGIAVGIPVAIAAGRAIATLLYGLGSADLRALGLASGAMLVVAAAASLVPARRATRVDPLIALRTE